MFSTSAIEASISSSATEPMGWTKLNVHRISKKLQLWGCFNNTTDFCFIMPPSEFLPKLKISEEIALWSEIHLAPHYKRYLDHNDPHYATVSPSSKEFITNTWTKKLLFQTEFDFNDGFLTRIIPDNFPDPGSRNFCIWNEIRERTDRDDGFEVQRRHHELQVPSIGWDP